jgi:5'-nucleotidase
MDTPLILITNDDGIHAPGILALSHAMNGIGDVWVFAPDRQQSAVGHGVSLHRPLRVHKLQERWFSVDGTPTDCVMLAVRDLLPRGKKPDLVLSGINIGANLGDDVTYSGTVAGAFEGMLLGCKAIAFSDVSYNPRHLDTAARFARRLSEQILEHGLETCTMLNVNVPDLPYDQLGGVAITKMGRRDYQDEIVTRHDPRGNAYFWIGGAEPSHFQESGTDFEAIEGGKVSVTPLHRDLTHFAAIDALKNQKLGL